MLASSSTPAEAAIGDLLGGGKLTSGKTVVGPLGPDAIRLLRVIWKARTDLTTRKGADVATALRTSYLAAKATVECAPVTTSPPAADAPPPEAARPEAAALSPAPRWRLHALRSHSIRGIAARGVTFSFAFDCVPTLIYGPNGSGKSSLLSAIGWVLTGRVVTDCEEESENFSLYAPPTAAGKVVKIREWPVIHTLPQSDPVAAAPDCWAVLTLKSEDGSRTLHLRRSLDKDLEQSSDEKVWAPCPSLSDHGISPLDIQLSVSAATMFGRRTLESSPDTRHLLSMMLGYDALEDLGTLVTTLATNLTKAANTERDALVARRGRQKLLLATIPTKIRDGLELKQHLVGLTGEVLPDATRIEEVEALAATAIGDAETALASLLGIKTEGPAVPDGLADALTLAVRALEAPTNDLFPRVRSLFPAPAAEGERAEDVTTIGNALKAFEHKAKSRIAARLAWWKKEVTAGSKVTLLIQAATHFDPSNEACPVCEQEISGTDVASQLAVLKGASADLRVTLQVFFRDLADEVRTLVPAAVLGLSAKDPARCVREDWAELRGELGRPLETVAERFDPLIEAIATALPPVKFSAAELIPSDADSTFARAATAFVAVLRDARRGITLSLWASRHLAAITNQLLSIVTSPDGGEGPSLLSALSRGKHAAADVEPIVFARAGLKNALEEAAAIKTAELALAALEEMQKALEMIKPLGKYAVAEVERVFTVIREKTIENTRKLYPHANPALSPSRLHLNKGRDKTVEAYLSAGTFEVPGQHVANAGLLRAIALAFYFALLERHPGGIGFVVMDDPILSLDDNHREAWSANILKPALVSTQVIVATHQRQFLNHCKTDFHPGRLVELNPRTQSKQITYRPGDRLDRAEELLGVAWTSVANELRKYREDLIITLDAYSPTPFFNAGNLRHSLDAYVALQAPHPLASTNQAKIGKRIRDEKVTRVLDPGSHSMTEADVTDPMVRDCLRELKELDATFRNELDRLEGERLRLLKSRSLPIIPAPAEACPPPPATIPFERLRLTEDAAPWDTPVRLKVIGAAAAQTHGCVVDLADEPRDSDFASGGAVLVASDTLCPVARPGQWVLLSGEAEDGDLAAVKDAAGNRYLRRVWSAGDAWVLEAVNPSAGVPPLSVRKSNCIVRKVNGVCYGPRKEPGRTAGKLANEWAPRQDFKVASIAAHFGITVAGTSLDPIALDGQVVLVSRKIDSRFDQVARGSLAVVETDDDLVGSVIKRIFPNEEMWLLASPNPIEPRDPIAIAKERIIAVWPVRGVLFEVTEQERFDVDADDAD